MIGVLVAVELIVVMIGTAVPTSRLSAKLVVVDELHQNVSCHYYTYVYMHIMSYHVITCHVMSCHVISCVLHRYFTPIDRVHYSKHACIRS